VANYNPDPAGSQAGRRQDDIWRASTVARAGESVTLSDSEGSPVPGWGCFAGTERDIWPASTVCLPSPQLRVFFLALSAASVYNPLVLLQPMARNRGAAPGYTGLLG
jgi:chitodextrinase